MNSYDEKSRCMVVTYRSFRNTDPPRIVEVWNEAMTGRGCVRLASSSALETYVFSKPYFDPKGVILAVDGEKVIGFAHAGFAPNPTETGLSDSTGVICMVAVHPNNRHHGVGAELIHQSEEYLRGRGVTTIFAGPTGKMAPFYAGLYGGSEPSGFLVSDSSAEPFLKQLGYSPCETTIIYQRKLQQPIRIMDPRFVSYRQKFDLQVSGKTRPTWWQNCVYSAMDPWEFNLLEETKTKSIANALLVELEGFSWKWNQPSVGIIGFHVDPEYRQKAIGKFFMGQILRFLYEQCFQIAEVHVLDTNIAGLSMCRNLGFAQVDLGKVYSKQIS